MSYEPKTVAEQAAFEFGKQVHFLRFGRAVEEALASKYAFAHQWSAFPRSDNGYDRLKTAFCAGCEFNA